VPRAVAVASAFNLKQKYSAHGNHDYLQHIAGDENVEAQPGCPRCSRKPATRQHARGLSLLDHAIAYLGGGVTFKGVRGMLGWHDRFGRGWYALLMP